MAELDPPPTLASLRRKMAPRRAPAPAADGPSLFDLVPPVSGPPIDSPRPPAVPPQVPVLSGEQVASGRATSVPPPAPRPLADSAPRPLADSAPRPLADSAPRPLADSAPRPWTVTGLVRHVRGLVEGGYARVTVEGEISNWRPAGSGHCYFTVKDAGAQLSAVLFRRQAALLRFAPGDGDAVKLHGQLSVFETRGQLQLVVEWMQQAGIGALLAEVQRLKEQLRREGLFDRKRPLPPFPRCIGVITSLQGAALRDIVKVCRRRHAAVHLLVYPAAVQGPHCAAEITAGLRWFNAHPDQAEVVLVARGGGSWEDLHGFDHEGVARAIAASSLPVITGIGHATDATVADAAADVCAPTPSAAAELLTAAHHRVEDHLARLKSRLLRAGRFELLRAGQHLARLNVVTMLRRVESGLNRRAQRVDELRFRAQSALSYRLRAQTNRLKTADSRLARGNPAVRLGTDRRRLESLHARLERAAAHRLTQAGHRTEAARTRLEALSPLRVLERGYALVYGAEGHLLRSPTEVREGEEITARLAEGTFRAQVVR